MTGTKPTLEELRSNTGLPAAELQRRAGVSSETWRRIKRGQLPVSRDTVVRILRVLNEELDTEYTPESIDAIIA